MNMDYVLNFSSYSQSQREGGGESTYIGGGPALDQHNTHGDVKTKGQNGAGIMARATSGHNYHISNLMNSTI